MYSIIGYGTIGKLIERILISRGESYSIFTTDFPYDKGKFASTPDSQKILHNQHIVIATPPSTHLELAKFYIERGKYVLLEKPAIIKTDHLDLLRSLLNSRKLYLAYHTKHNPIILYLQELIRSKSIASISVSYKENVSNYHNVEGWIFDREISGGGCLIDSGINIFSVLTSICSKFEIDTSEIYHFKHPVEDYVKITATSASGTKINILLDWNSPNEKREYKVILNDQTEIIADLANSYIKVNGLIIINENTLVVDQLNEYKNMLNNYEVEVLDSTYINNALSPILSVFEAYSLTATKGNI